MAFETGEYIDYLYNVLILGDCEIGKSSILRRICKNEFSDEYLSTIGVDFNTKRITIDSKRIKLHIWDLSGQERFKKITNSYYRGAHGLVLVYDITNEESFENIEENWMTSIKENANENVKTILIGNKCDLEEKREISKEEGKEFADKYQIPFYEVSAKNNINIDNIFFEITRNIRENNGSNIIAKIKTRINYTIQEDFQKLFERKEFYDFEIECKDDQNPLNKIKIPIHKLIIQNRLKINENQIKNELYSILSQNSQKEVDILLKWIYFGKVLYQDLSIFKEWKNKLSNIFHKIILITRSELYRGMFNISEDKSNSVHEYSNKQTETIQSLIHFFYTDNIPKIENEKIYEELKECVDYFQLNSERLIQIIPKIEIKIKNEIIEQKKNNCLIF
ncbi:ras-related protein rab-13 [Anaeramoeba ignava]|uniref:Ras-related protein rab-13 n=1 Tax=Anaeramoeba ignava TaxID=1746090 RepID=A0A9Q0LRI3_ANAIG|nr:ras-related protein rab-13 [Anaeramoeba ignava]